METRQKEVSRKTEGSREDEFWNSGMSLSENGDTKEKLVECESEDLSLEEEAVAA